MTVKEIAEKLGLAPVSVTDDTREVQGGYAGDLLSWVMGRAHSGDAWITIMSNQNIVAVALLADVSCILLAEGVEPDEGVAALAAQKGINLLQSPLSAYETALRLQAAL